MLVDTEQLSCVVLQVDAELGATFNEVLAPQDVATYGALCSLASFSRPEMKTRIIDNIAFREFLELMPEVQSAARHQPVVYLCKLGSAPD